MAEKVIGVEVKVDGKQAEQSVGSFKKQLREANNEVVNLTEKFGATSREAIAAAQKVAKLKDAIGDAKALSDAFSPDAKFNAFAGAIQGAVSGFSALQGAQALFGTESEELNKTLLKVQAALLIASWSIVTISAGNTGTSFNIFNKSTRLLCDNPLNILSSYDYFLLRRKLQINKSSVS